MTTKALETAIDTFANHTDMTEREAEAYVHREIAGHSRGETARLMGISESTVDTQVQNAKPKAHLPHIDQVKRISATNTVPEQGKAWEIWFENGAMLRYVWNTELEEIVEQVTRADDPHSIWSDMAVNGSEDELEEYALESISEYTRSFRDDVESCRHEWSPVYEAIVCHRA